MKGGGHPDKGSASSYKLVGGQLVGQVMIGGKEVSCLMDTGSMVSIISEDFFFKEIQPNGGLLQKPLEWLKPRAANGLKLPYIGYVELDVEMIGTALPKCGLLAQKDTGKKLKPHISGLLGMNILRDIPEII